MGSLVAEYFTDPLSPWCWAAQPTVRRLQYEFDELELVPRMTLLFPEALPDTSGERYVAAARGSGMPVVASLWAEGIPSSRPAGAAVCAVRESAPDRLDAYLHRIREAVFVAGEPMDTPDRLCAIAESVGGIDTAALERELGGAGPTDALVDDVERARDVASEIDAASVEVRGDVDRLSVAPRLAALNRRQPVDAEVEDEAPAELVAPPTVRLGVDERPVVADLRIGYQRLSAPLGGQAIPRAVAGLSDKFGTGRLSMHVPQDLAETLSSREYLVEVRAYVRRFERVYVAEVVAGTGRSRETCRASLETLAAAGAVERLDGAGDAWRMIEDDRRST